jgi:hemerythrin-like domain-containing protein
MQRPTDTLRTEHATTAVALETLAAVGRHVAAGGSFPADDVATLLRFLREFLLAVHLRKEVEAVCPAVAMRGDDEAASLVGDLVRMQEEVTELVHCLVLFWEPVGELTADERRGFAEATAALAARVRRMREIEEQSLFPMCDAMVPADDQLDWVARFADFEAGRDDARTWRRRLASLARRWVA